MHIFVTTIGILFLILAIIIFCRLLFLYYYYKKDSKEIIVEIRQIVNNLCAQENIPLINVGLMGFWGFEPKRLASFRGDKIAISISPLLPKYIQNSNLPRNWYILFIAAHEVCHYIQYLKGNSTDRKKREKEATEVSRLYADMYSRRVSNEKLKVCSAHI